jgi:hypothetical protein
MKIKEPGFVQWTVAATATQLDSLIPAGPWSKISVKNAEGAANPVYVGPSTVTNVPANAGAELSANQAIDFDRSQFDVRTDKVYLVGTVAGANIVFITCHP